MMTTGFKAIGAVSKKDAIHHAEKTENQNFQVVKKCSEKDNVQK